MIETLKHDLFNRSSKSLLLAAKYVLCTLGRENVPDWVECLANGNPGLWESVIDVTKEIVTYDEANHE